MVKLKSVGVLALQGDYERHITALKSLGIATKPVRTSSDLSSVDGLIIPGGESTTMTNLLRRNDLEISLRDFVMKNPVMGTCAGLILLSNQTEHTNVIGLGVIDVDVDRNGYGSQRDSFSTDIFLDFNDGDPFHAIFIRAPRFREVGREVDVSALDAWARENMAGYKVPRSFRVVARLPLNANGKVAKDELRARVAQRLEGSP